MRRDEWNQTSTALVDATMRLLEREGASLAYVGQSELRRGPLKVSVIGFGGDQFRGMLALSIDPALLARITPVEGGGDDWLCELSNLLLGDFKRALLRLGIRIHLSTPMLMEGTDMTLETYAMSAVAHEFAGEGGERVVVVLDAVAERSAHVEPTEVELQDAGMVLLFDGGDHA